MVGPGKKTERILCQAFHDGARRCGVVADVVQWDMIEIDGYDAIAIAGAREGTTELIYRKCVGSGKTFFYIDNGYFSSRWHLSTDSAFFRITENAMQHDGVSGPFDESRFQKLGIEILEWRKRRTDTSILIALQSDWWYRLHGMEKGSFIEMAARKMMDVCPGRIIRIRDKPVTRQQLAETDRIDWDSLHVVASHSSATCFEAILYGIPGCCFHRSASWALIDPAAYDFASAPEIPTKDRLRWASVLASNQWTIDEIQRGDAWNFLMMRA